MQSRVSRAGETPRLFQRRAISLVAVGFNDVGLSVRRSETSDDAEMADVFNRAHAHIAGTVIRSAEDIAWRCRRQPGMPDEGGILVEDLAGSMLGYAFVKRNGDITEFAVDPDGPRRGAARALVAAVRSGDQPQEQRGSGSTYRSPTTSSPEFWKRAAGSRCGPRGGVTSPRWTPANW